MKNVELYSHISKIVLEELIIQKPFSLPENLIQTTSIEYVKNYIKREITGHIRSIMLSKEVEKTTDVYTEELEVPASWLDSLKLRFFPNFLLNIFPPYFRSYIIRRTIENKYYHTCPHINLAHDSPIHIVYLNASTFSPKEKKK